MTLYELNGVVMETATPTPIIQANIIASKSRDIVPIYDLPEWREGRAAAVVGGGPSLANNLDKLKEYDIIFACGSVHDYLVNNGIIPTYCVLVDPDPLVINYLKNIYHIDNKCKYLISSQCAPETFEHLKYNPAYVWHAGGNEELFRTGDIAVGGGCTVGTRAMVIAMCLGYNTLHLFGMDSCITEEGVHHAYDFDNPEVEKIGPIHEIALGGRDGRKFKVAEYMLGQIFDFKNLLGHCANRIRVEVHGGGALAYILELAKQKQLELNK